MTQSEHDNESFPAARWYSELKQIPRGLDVVVHVGAPKTGTSAIQKYLWENRDYLAQHGYHYPAHGMRADSISSGQSTLYTAIIEDDHPEELFERYLKEATDKHCTLLLSSETFWVIPEKFCQLLQGRAFAVLVFLRHPFDAVVSSYNQLVKRHFSTMSLADFVKKNAEQNRLHMAGDRLSKWGEQIDDEKLVVNSYLKSAMLTIGIPQVIARVLGLPQNNEHESPQQLLNSSYPPHILTLKRMLNVVMERNDNVNREVDGILQRVAEQFNRENLARTGRPSIDIAPDTLNMFNRYLKGVDAQLSSRYRITLLSELRENADATENTDEFTQVVAALNRNPRIYKFLRDRIDRYSQDSGNLKTALSDTQLRDVLRRLDILFPKKSTLMRLVQRIFPFQ